jgi:hypothetical protein
MEITDLEPFGKSIKCDVSTLTYNDLSIIKQQLHDNYVVVIDSVTKVNMGQFHALCVHNGISNQPKIWCSLDEYPDMMRIGNIPFNDENDTGLFGTTDFSWHHDGQFSVDKEHFTGLYGNIIEKQSFTDTANGKMVFDSLDPEFQEHLRDLEYELSHEINDTYLKTHATINLTTGDRQIAVTSLDDIKLGRTRHGFTETPIRVTKLRRPLVVRHPITNEEGLNFPFLYISKIIGDSLSPDEAETLFYKLIKCHTDPRFILNFEWFENAILLMDQIHCIHKRDEYEGKRELIRIAFWDNK